MCNVRDTCYIFIVNKVFIKIFAYVCTAGPPSITSPSTQIEVIEGHELILTCAATNDIKSPFNADISWYGPQGELIKETDKNIDISAIKIENVLTSALKFKSVNHTLTGVSKCKASNHPMSSSEFNFTITVECT